MRIADITGTYQYLMGMRLDDPENLFREFEDAGAWCHTKKIMTDDGVQRMKIVVLGPVYPYRGGIATYTTLLIRELQKKHNIKVLSFKRQYPAWLYPGKSDKDPSNLKLDFPVLYLLDTVNPLTWLKVIKWLRHQKPDLLILQWWTTFMAPAFASISFFARRFGIPVLYVIQNVLPHEGGWIHQPLTQLALGQGNFHLTHTLSQQNRLIELVKNANARTCNFPILSNMADQKYKIKPEIARQNLNLPLEDKVLLFFGFVRPYKGLMVLLEAAALLHTAGINVHVLVAGEFWYDKQSYLDTITRLKLEKYIHLEDRYVPDEELDKIFSAVDVLVAPYVDGTWSGVAALALGYGVPIVLTEKSAAGMDPRNLDPQAIAQSGDAASLAQAIRYQLEKPISFSISIHESWHNVIETIESFLPT